MFWSIVAFALNHGVFVSVLILPVECILVPLCPPSVQIFGSNPLRDWIAGLMEPILGDRAHHLAGALTDFKKVVLYGFCAIQLLYTRLVLLDDRSPSGWTTGFVTALRARIEPQEARKLTWCFAPRKPLEFIALLLGVLAVISVTYISLVVWLWPSKTDHFLGPVGKGLVSVWSNPALGVGGKLAFTAYRGWYLAAAIPMLLAAAFSVPGCLRVAVKPKCDRPPPPNPISEDGRALKFLGAPLAVLIGVLALGSLTYFLDIGELYDRPRDVAVLAGVALCIWVFVGACIYRRQPAQPLSLFAAVASGLRSVLWGWRGAAWLAGVLMVGASIAKSFPEEKRLLAIAKSSALNGLSEYLGWNRQVAREQYALTFDSVRTTIQPYCTDSGGVPSSERIRSLGHALLSDEPDFNGRVVSKLTTIDNLAEWMTCQIVLRAMHHSTASALFRSPSLNVDGSQPADIEAAASAWVPPPIPVLYDRTFMKSDRPFATGGVARKFAQRKIPLLRLYPRPDAAVQRLREIRDHLSANLGGH